MVGLKSLSAVKAGYITKQQVKKTQDAVEQTLKAVANSAAALLGHAVPIQDWEIIGVEDQFTDWNSPSNGANNSMAGILRPPVDGYSNDAIIGDVPNAEAGFDMEVDDASYTTREASMSGVSDGVSNTGPDIHMTDARYTDSLFGEDRSHAVSDLTRTMNDKLSLGPEVPLLVLTTPEGENIFEDDIPPGQPCDSDAASALRRAKFIECDESSLLPVDPKMQKAIIRRMHRDRRKELNKLDREFKELDAHEEQMLMQIAWVKHELAVLHGDTPSSGTDGSQAPSVSFFGNWEDGQMEAMELEVGAGEKRATGKRRFEDSEGEEGRQYKAKRARSRSRSRKRGGVGMERMSIPSWC